MPERAPQLTYLDTSLPPGRIGDDASIETMQPANVLHQPAASPKHATALNGAIEGWLHRQRLVPPERGQDSFDHTFLTMNRDGQPSSQNTKVVTNLAVQPNLPREVKLQEWEGQVEKVGRLYFYARLVDLTAGENDESEEVDFPIDDLTESDRKLLVPGAVFRWIIGYRYTQGQKDRFSRVVIRRLPIWTTDEIQAADEKAAHLYEILSRHRGDRATSARSG